MLITVEDEYQPCPKLVNAAIEPIHQQSSAILMINSQLQNAYLTNEPNQCLTNDIPLYFKSPHYETYKDRNQEVYDALRTSYSIGVFIK